jgi:hypothetical protein
MTRRKAWSSVVSRRQPTTWPPASVAALLLNRASGLANPYEPIMFGVGMALLLLRLAPYVLVGVWSTSEAWRVLRGQRR